MSETDAPFLTPVPHRGERNSPVYIPEVVKKITEIRGEPFEVVKKALLDNVYKNFGI
jgi:TatD DNase family protein